jgi:hypothetical protein
MIEEVRGSGMNHVGPAGLDPLLKRLPRPDGRGYSIAALRASPALRRFAPHHPESIDRGRVFDSVDPVRPENRAKSGSARAIEPVSVLS